MQHNRKLHISTAGTRKTKHWPETEILWSEFVDRVKNSGTKYGDSGRISCDAKIPTG